jgi:hypothetical protein
VPAPLLNDGEYSLDVFLVHDRKDVLATENSLLSFRVEEDALGVRRLALAARGRHSPGFALAAQPSYPSLRKLVRSLVRGRRSGVRPCTDRSAISWTGGRDKRAIEDWHKAGSSIPPPHAVKQAVLRDYARRYRLGVLVETGTYLWGNGTRDDVHVSAHLLDRIERGFVQTRTGDRFSGQSHIELICGDSARLLPSVLRCLKEPALFWLDGHYSGRRDCARRGGYADTDAR